MENASHQTNVCVTVVTNGMTPSVNQNVSEAARMENALRQTSVDAPKVSMNEQSMVPPLVHHIVTKDALHQKMNV